NFERCSDCWAAHACLPARADDRLPHASRVSSERQPRLGSLMDPVAEFLGTLQMERGASPNTLMAYRRDLEGFHEFLRKEHRPLAETSARDLTRYLHWLRARGLGSKSVARHLSAVRGLYRHLLETGGVTRDPTEHLDSPKPPRRLPR